MKQVHNHLKVSTNSSNTGIIGAGKLSSYKWPGAISVAELINNKTYTIGQINNAKQKINNYYVKVNGSAKTRCIDGRQDPKLDSTNIGPQVPGGSLGAALAYRLGAHKEDLTKTTFLQDTNYIINKLLSFGLKPGGHRDVLNSTSQNNKVGCGALDNMEHILKTMLEPKLVNNHKCIVQNLLNNDYAGDIYLCNLGMATILNGQSERYFMDKQNALDILEKNNKSSIATLSGSHNEVFVIINYVSNTTFDSNRFSKENNGMQAFGYDIWRTKQVAELLFPEPKQATDKSNYITARVMFTVATLMALTDGSQELLYRVNK